MKSDVFKSQEDEINPYIALADLAITLVLILAFFVAAANALGRTGWEQVRYREAQQEFRSALERQLPPRLQPQENSGKNDPLGVQRWTYPGCALFFPGTARLLPEGQQSLQMFARVLKSNKQLWRRIRVEGHTMPPAPGELDDWELSARRAASVARVIHAMGHIPSYYLAVAGRAGQNPVDKPNSVIPQTKGSRY